MPNFGYHFARWRGNLIRALYRLFLSFTVRRPVRTRQNVPFAVFSYSSEEMLPEQVASIRSFLRHAGRPAKFTVVSDGSHSEKSLDLLRKIDPCIVATRLQPGAAAVVDRYSSYLENHPTGRQLGLIMSLPREGDGPSLYIDADVLFFPGAREIGELAATDAPALYLADCQFSGDDRLLRTPAEKEQPVNTGVLFLKNRLDWSLSIARFRELPGEPTFFTNQTMTHLTMHQNGAKPFAAAKFVLQLDDQFEFGDRYASPSLILRHYVNPVRHKFWTSSR